MESHLVIYNFFIKNYFFSTRSPMSNNPSRNSNPLYKPFPKGALIFHIKNLILERRAP